MVNFFKPAVTHNMVATITAIAFTTAIIAPPSAYADVANMNFNDLAFGVKMEKIYEKVKNAINKGETNKIVGYMFDFKSEIEQYTGKKIDIIKSIDQAEQEAKSRGQKVDSRYLKAIKKEFDKQEKKHTHRAIWLAQCIELDIPYTAVEADIHFEMDYLMAKSSHKDKEKEVLIEDVPVKVVVGVTLSLCGLFLWFVPIPVCQTCGSWLINTGIGILGSNALDHYDAYDRENRRKDK